MRKNADRASALLLLLKSTGGLTEKAALGLGSVLKDGNKPRKPPGRDLWRLQRSGHRPGRDCYSRPLKACVHPSQAVPCRLFRRPTKTAGRKLTPKEQQPSGFSASGQPKTPITLMNYGYPR
jgi:hypothetical protein